MQSEEAIIFSTGPNNNTVVEDLETPVSKLCIAMLEEYATFFQYLENDTERRILSQSIVEGIVRTVFIRPKFFQRIAIEEGVASSYFRELNTQEVTDIIFTHLKNTTNTPCDDSYNFAASVNTNHSDPSAILIPSSDGEDDDGDEVDMEEFFDFVMNSVTAE